MTGDQKKILIVEDNSDNSALVEKILKHKGYSTFIAEDGFKALDYCDEVVPDLILMDISLPGMDGLELTRRLREREGFNDLPIIALTAHAFVAFKEKTKEAGYTSYLAKPFLPNELAAIVKKYI